MVRQYNRKIRCRPQPGLASYLIPAATTPTYHSQVPLKFQHTVLSPSTQHAMQHTRACRSLQSHAAATIVPYQGHMSTATGNARVLPPRREVMPQGLARSSLPAKAEHHTLPGQYNESGASARLHFHFACKPKCAPDEQASRCTVPRPTAQALEARRRACQQRGPRPGPAHALMVRPLLLLALGPCRCAAPLARVAVLPVALVQHLALLATRQKARGGVRKRAQRVRHCKVCAYKVGTGRREPATSAGCCPLHVAVEYTYANDIALTRKTPLHSHPTHANAALHGRRASTRIIAPCWSPRRRTMHASPLPPSPPPPRPPGHT